jgi:2-keto-4-pentenoate hydratase
VPSETIGWDLADRAEAYAVQALVAAELGPVAAWKTGAPSPDAEPIVAPVFANVVWCSPARLAASRFLKLGIEVEIAYRLGRDLPARPRPYDREEVLAAIDAILPAVEIVDSRCAACDRLDPLWKLADNQINGGLVVGRAREDWRGIDPQNQPVQLSIDGETVASGRGGNSAGDPLRLLVWMASNVGAHCGGLRAGQVITTGSLTGLRFVAPGAEVMAELAGLGPVEVSFEV